MLVHAPVACWTLTPLCDALAFGLYREELWIVGAFLTVVGSVLGALAATAGSLDFERGHAAAPRIAIAHAVLMASALTLSIISALGRLGPDYAVLAPPHWWAMGASALAFVLMIGGAWCGGELVYGRGVGVKRN